MPAWVSLSRDYLVTIYRMVSWAVWAQPIYIEKISRGYLEDGELRPGCYPDPPEQGEAGAGQQEAARATTTCTTTGHAGGGRGAEQWSGV